MMFPKRSLASTSRFLIRSTRDLSRETTLPSSFRRHVRARSDYRNGISPPDIVSGHKEVSMLFATLGLASLFMWSRENTYEYAPPTACDQAATATTDFHLFAALDAMEETEKVRLAQIIQDLHALANDESANRGRGLRRYVTMITRRITTGVISKEKDVKPSIRNDRPTIDGDLICLEHIEDVSHISKQAADQIIRSLQLGRKLNFQSLMTVLEAAAEVLRDEPNLIDLRKKQEVDGSRISVVGDPHGSLRSLSHILDTLNPDKDIVVFDGDFVDRGSSSLEVLVILLLLKLSRPEQVFLLRGNHEDVMVASVYGFQDEIRKKYSSYIDDIWEAVGEVFSSLPIALRTKTACVLHGGIPSDKFDLEDLNKVPGQVRFNMRSTIEPRSHEEKLLSGILWSDPTDRDPDYIGENPRGVGIVFGTAIARRFLGRNKLQHLIRGHEPASNGLSNMDCGYGRSVLTIFSAAAYPADHGSNLGAVLHLDADGNYSHETFSIQECTELSNQKERQRDKGMEKLKSLVGFNKSKLERAFEKVQNQGMVSVAQWAEVMTQTIEASGIPWAGLQPRIAPVERSSGLIRVDKFLADHSLRVHGKDGLNHDEAETLAENSEMLLTVFKFLDSNGDGTLSPAEFATGIALLNRGLPEERQLKNPSDLFSALDTDGNGEISFEEFTHGFGLA